MFLFAYPGYWKIHHDRCVHMMFPLLQHLGIVNVSTGQSFHSEEKWGSERVWGVAETTRQGGNRRTWTRGPLQDSSPRGLTRWTWSGPTWRLRIFWPRCLASFVIGLVLGLSSQLTQSPLTSALVLTAVTGVAFKVARPGFCVLPRPKQHIWVHRADTRQDGHQWGDLEEAWVGHSEGPPKPSVSSSASAVSRKRSKSDRESSDLLTDVGGVSWAPRAPISSWDQVLSLGLPGDTGVSLMGTACWRSDSQGDTRHRATSCREARGSTYEPEFEVQPSFTQDDGGGRGPCSKVMDRDSSICSWSLSRLRSSSPGLSAGRWWALQVEEGRVMAGECWWPTAAPGFSPPGCTLLPAGLSPTPFCSPGCTWPPTGGTAGPAPQKPEAAAGLLWWAGLSTPEVVGEQCGGAHFLQRWGYLGGLSCMLSRAWEPPGHLPSCLGLQWRSPSTSHRCGPSSPAAGSRTTSKNATIKVQVQQAGVR